jgi:mannosyltransferase OCH1-like enzyme
VPDTSIPQVFHRIWFGGPEPKDHGPLVDSWARHHPSWSIMTWTETNLPPLRNQPLFDSLSSAAGRADVARYELLHRFGGVYIDVDFEALRPIDDLLMDVRGFAAFEDDLWVAIGILGAEPGHEVFAAMVDAVRSSPPGPPNQQTGPQFFTRTLNRLRHNGALDFTLFPPNVFYPYHFSEPERADGPFPDAYAVHRWERGWEDRP